MLKKVLSAFLAAVFVSSLINVKVDANTKTIPGDINQTLSRFIKTKEKPANLNNSSTLGDAISTGNVSNLVEHRNPSKKISRAIDNYESLRSGTVNNVVLNVRFNGEAEYLTTVNKGKPMREVFNNLYNEANISLNNYYKEISNGKLDLNTSFVGVDTNNTQSIELSNERNYYRPYSESNQLGYFEYVVVNSNTFQFVANMYMSDNVVDTDPSDGIVTQHYVESTPGVVAEEVFLYSYAREMQLIKEVTAKANDSGILNLNLDKNNDDNLDAVTLMLGLAESDNLAADLDWGELLWPHQNSVLKNISQEEIEVIKYCFNIDLSFLNEGGFELSSNYVDKYNLYTSDFVLMDGISVESDKGDVGHVGVVTHEMAHVLNLPDFYNYVDQYDACVGKWDLMAGTGVVPQYVNGYLRQLAGWLNDSQIPTIQKDGEYELKPVSSADSTDTNGYIITLPEYPNQLFYVEYRKSEGLFDGGEYYNSYYNQNIKTINDDESGLVIYRIDNSIPNEYNMLMPGNFSGSPYNLYVFRPEAEDSYFNENNAALNGITRTSFGNINGTVLKDSLTFQDGENLVNSRVLINNVKVDPTSNKIKFTVDAKDPSVVKAEIVDNKILVELDEKLSEESNLDLIKLTKNGVEQNIDAKILSDNTTLEIALQNGNIDGNYTLNIAKDAIKDLAGKTLLNNFTKDLSKVTIVNPTGVSLDKTEVSLKETETTNLTATVMPENATNKNVVWTSSDESIAKVDANGKVTAIKEGVAEISVKTIDGNYTAKCKITVSKKEVKPVDPSNPTTDNGNSNNSNSNNKLPYTGQESSMLQVGIIALILGMVLTFRFKAKSNN